MIHVAIDFETKPIGPHNVCPEPVCLSLASRDQILGGNVPGGLIARTAAGVNIWLVGNNVPGMFSDILSGLLSDPTVHFHGANLAYDLGVAVYHDPDLVPLIFAAGHAGRLHDVLIVERLLRLSTTGNMDFVTLPDGTNKNLEYSLGKLEKRYINRDRSSAKGENNEQDVWRLNYIALDGMPAAKYPAEAAQYAMDDAEGTLLVHEAQALKRTESGHGSANTEEIQAFVDFCFTLITAQGMAVDAEQVERLEVALDEVMSPEHHKPLYDAGLAEPAVPERVRRTKKGEVMRHKNGPYKGQPMIVQARKEKINKKAVQQHVLDLFRALDRKPKLTDKGRELQVKPDDPNYVKYIATDRDTLIDLEGLDPTGLLDVYATRQKYAKVRSTYLPVLRTPEGRVWPGYNVVVSTGRSSSRGGGRKPLYPSCNIQQIPGLTEGNLNVRACFVPDPGHVFCSIDFSSLELCSFAQTCYSLFGYSALRDAINAGYDAHAYLGAQLAAALSPEFRRALDDMGIYDKERRYKAFLALKSCGDPEQEKLFKHYRTFAKPVGLGFPGGLGIRTFRTFAKSTYGVRIESDELAETLKNLWFDTYPEAKDYLKRWVPAQEDAYNASDKMGGLYYDSPLGMHRANANYCACANGNALQTPSAEGFKLAVIDTVERCVSPEFESDPLHGCMVVAQVHDEILFQFPRKTARARGEYAARIMVENMKLIMPDVNIRAEPAYMTRWLKQAEGIDRVWSLTAGGEMFSEPL
jgi:DNA polymerase I-like protein with 3'-5' exonuclease and polymerase domains